MTDINIHNVKSITANFCDAKHDDGTDWYFTNKLEITTDEGETVSITLFSHTRERVQIKESDDPIT